MEINYTKKIKNYTKKIKVKLSEDEIKTINKALQIVDEIYDSLSKISYIDKYNTMERLADTSEGLSVLLDVINEEEFEIVELI